MATFDRRTKIVATIGPSSSSEEMLFRLIEAGMDAARLNFSHGTHDDHAERAKLVREAQKRAGRPLALIADLQGPKLRVGELESPLVLAVGDELEVTGDEHEPGALPISPPVLSEVLRPGHDLLVDDGRVRLRIEEVNGGRARASVLVGGPVEAHKGVNLPGVPIPVPSLTEKDLHDLEFALGLDIDYVAL
jgi:pyruvate kinase